MTGNILGTQQGTCVPKHKNSIPKLIIPAHFASEDQKTPESLHGRCDNLTVKKSPRYSEFFSHFPSPHIHPNGSKTSREKNSSRSFTFSNLLSHRGIKNRETPLINRDNLIEAFAEKIDNKDLFKKTLSACVHELGSPCQPLKKEAKKLLHIVFLNYADWIKQNGQIEKNLIILCTHLKRSELNALSQKYSIENTEETKIIAFLKTQIKMRQHIESPYDQTHYQDYKTGLFHCIAKIRDSEQYLQKLKQFIEIDDGEISLESKRDIDHLRRKITATKAISIDYFIIGCRKFAKHLDETWFSECLNFLRRFIEAATEVAPEYQDSTLFQDIKNYVVKNSPEWKSKHWENVVNFIDGYENQKISHQGQRLLQEIKNPHQFKTNYNEYLRELVRCVKVLQNAFQDIEEVKHLKSINEETPSAKSALEEMRLIEKITKNKAISIDYFIIGCRKFAKHLDETWFSECLNFLRRFIEAATEVAPEYQDSTLFQAIKNYVVKNSPEWKSKHWENVVNFIDGYENQKISHQGQRLLQEIKNPHQFNTKYTDYLRELFQCVRGLQNAWQEIEEIKHLKSINEQTPSAKSILQQTHLAVAITNKQTIAREYFIIGCKKFAKHLNENIFSESLTFLRRFIEETFEVLPNNLDLTLFQDIKNYVVKNSPEWKSKHWENVVNFIDGYEK